MKPRPFKYVVPRTLDDALALLAEHREHARPLAGGQSLVQRLNMREVSPEIIVDLNCVPELDFLRREVDGRLAIGAMTRQQRLVDAELVRAGNPMLAAVAESVAFPAVRSRGTLGGSVANAEPGAQLPLLLTILDAQATVAARGRLRATPVADLFAGTGATTLAPDELLIELAVPALGIGAGYGMGEFRRGHAGPPLVTVLAMMELDASGAVSAARLGVSGSSEIPLRLAAEEALLVGQAPAPELFVEVAERAAAHVVAGDPVLADAGLRRQATRALLARALAEAVARASRHARSGERGQNGQQEVGS